MRRDRGAIPATATSIARRRRCASRPRRSADRTRRRSTRAAARFTPGSTGARTCAASRDAGPQQPRNGRGRLPRPHVTLEGALRRFNSATANLSSRSVPRPSRYAERASAWQNSRPPSSIGPARNRGHAARARDACHTVFLVNEPAAARAPRCARSPICAATEMRRPGAPPIARAARVYRCARQVACSRTSSRSAFKPAARELRFHAAVWRQDGQLTTITTRGSSVSRPTSSWVWVVDQPRARRVPAAKSRRRCGSVMPAWLPRERVSPRNDEVLRVGGSVHGLRSRAAPVLRAARAVPRATEAPIAGLVRAITPPTGVAIRAQALPTACARGVRLARRAGGFHGVRQGARRDLSAGRSRTKERAARRNGAALSPSSRFDQTALPQCMHFGGHGNRAAALAARSTAAPSAAGAVSAATS